MDALDKALKLTPEVNAKSEELEADALLCLNGNHKTHTTHFKMTKTQVTEVERTESSEDEDSHEQNTTTEKKKDRGCFARCKKKKS